MIVVTINLRNPLNEIRKLGNYNKNITYNELKFAEKQTMINDLQAA